MSADATLVRFRFVPTGSRFTVQAFAEGLLSFLGHSPTFAVRNFTGELALDRETLERGWCRVSVESASPQLLDDVRPADRADIEGRMRQEVLQVERYPEIVFEANELSASRAGPGRFHLQMRGRLTLCGVTNPLQVDTLLTDQGPRVVLAGNFALRPSDFGIRPVRALAGALRLKDHVAVSFSLVGEREGGT
jgi:polyisoprenoid-binding protein YceI